jgi:hypothetical protein
MTATEDAFPPACKASPKKKVAKTDDIHDKTVYKDPYRLNWPICAITEFREIPDELYFRFLIAVSIVTTVRIGSCIRLDVVESIVLDASLLNIVHSE